MTNRCTQRKLTEAMIQSLGSKIRALRETRDISLREFARALGEVSAAHISDIELGRRYPSDALLERIAKELKVPLRELQEYDNRAPIEDLKRRAEANPTYGFALRRMVEDGITGDELLRLLEDKRKREEDP